MTASKRAAPANRLLAALPAQSRREFVASCDEVELGFADVLCESGDRIRHVYFPIYSFISLLTTLDDGARLEVGIVGDEGMLGMSLILGVNIWSQHAVVQGTGTAWRMSAAAFSRYCNNDAPLRERLNRYVYVLMGQRALTAACAHHHLVENRVARWLLMTRDRAHSNRFHLTHETLAQMLGVRRVGITNAAHSLHARGLINYRRGDIAILNGAELEKASCRCYQQAIEMYEQTLGSQSGASQRQSADN